MTRWYVLARHCLIACRLIVSVAPKARGKRENKPRGDAPRLYGAEGGIVSDEIEQVVDDTNNPLVISEENGH
jgi:hypothetical protein